MTDTGQFPGEGQPENAGALPGHPFPTDAVAPADPGAPAAFTFLDHGDAAEADGADEDDLLLMPGAQGAWMEQPAVQGGTHESGGRDTGSVDYGDVRTPPAPAAPAAPRRPLHMGPPVPDPTSGVVRSLADRGPAAPAPAPVRPPVPPAAPVPGPEYLDATTDETGAQQTPRLGEVPQQQPGTWDAQPQPPAATAFVPPQAAGTAAPAAPGPVVGDVASAAPEAPAGATSTGLSAIDAVVAAATGQIHVPPSVSEAPAEAAAPAAAVPGDAPQDGQVAAAEQGQDVPAAAAADARAAAAPQTAAPGADAGAAPQADQPVAAEAGVEAPADAASQAEQTADAAEAADVTPQAEQLAAAGAPAIASQAAEQVMDAAAADAASAGQAEGAADVAAQAGQAADVAAASDAAFQAGQLADAAAGAPAAAPQGEPAADAAADNAAVAPAEQVAGAAPADGAAAPGVAPQDGQAVNAATYVAPQAEQVIDVVAAADAPAGVPAEQPAAPVAAAAPQTDLPVVGEAVTPAGQAAGVVADAAPQAEQAVDVAAADAGQPADAAVVAPAEQVEGTVAAAVAAPQADQPVVTEAGAAAVAPAGEAAGVVADAAPQAEQAVDVAAADAGQPAVGAPDEQAADVASAGAAAPQAAQPDVVVAPGAPVEQPADVVAAGTGDVQAVGAEAGADASAQAVQAGDVAAADPAGAPVATPQAVQAAGTAAAAEAAPEAGQSAGSAAEAPQPAVPAAEAPAAPPAGAEPTAGVLADAGPAAPDAPAAAPEAPVSAPAPQGPADIPAAASVEASVQAAGVVADAPADTPSAPHAPAGVPQPEQATISEPQAPETEAVAHPPVADSEPRAAQPEQAAADLPEPAAGTSTGTDAQPGAEDVLVPAPHQSPDEPATDPAVVPAPRTAEPAAEPAVEPAAESTPAGDDARDNIPAATGYGDAEREAVHRVMRERRDIRNGFRTDPIPHEVLLRVLEAAHTAPSVGHSQPWDFVVIRSAETRQAMHELAQRQRDAYAKSLPKGRAKQFKELKIEAILETPVNIVVTADPTRGGRHTLGRHTQPQMAPYSSALAVENLWLAARAEGLGVGWVSFFDEREMVRALGLPDHLEVVAYLCVGYVDEFPDEPELMQAGWSKRRPLSWVVHEEEYGRRALPGEDPHDLLAETLRGIRPLDAKALGEAWERQKRMTKPSGALGMLEIISAQLCGLSRKCPPPIPEPAAVAIFAGDHGVHAQGVTAWPQEVTSQMVANFLGGGAVCNAFANQVGAEVCVVDVGVAGELPSTPGLLPRKIRPGTADFTAGPAMTREEAMRALEVGIETARDLVAAGNKALLTGEMGIANTTASAALISVFTGADPAEITGRGTGINDEMHARKIDVVRRALELHQPDPKDPIGVLAAIGGLEHAALVGLILGGASLRTPVILDGVSAGAAALVARAIAPEALAACIAGHRSAEPGHVAALTKLGLRPLVDLDLRLGEGTGALLALPIVQSAARAMHEVATFDAAGVTEKA
ncbi:nicotinate-nucleotide--dimethylbenzimidazole phosphoribosyltransferase [Streptomyces klenkii]|uniref:nicotinate-nucleotide--dimethylbenzimidazole phosphoribosyltransferase n=1 Tax=Streptomyces klenkii TaxID=1420899 RepID=UPI003440BF93